MFDKGGLTPVEAGDDLFEVVHALGMRGVAFAEADEVGGQRPDAPDGGTADAEAGSFHAFGRLGDFAFDLLRVDAGAELFGVEAYGFVVGWAAQVGPEHILDSLLFCALFGAW